MNSLINHLVSKASKLGAKGYRVVGWISPQSATSNPEGTLVTEMMPPMASGSSTPWYDAVD